MNALLDVRNVTKFFGGVAAVADVSFSLAPGETIGLIGPNGAGKTTLFGLISGFLRPDRGSILYEQKRIDGLPPHEICHRGVVRTFQLVQPFPTLTALQNVTAGTHLRVKDAKGAREAAAHLLERVGLGARMRVRAGDLTGAEQKRLELAKSLATRPQVILVDEVMAGLTPKEQGEAVDLIRSLQSDGIAMVIIEHVIGAVAALCPQVIVLHHGKELARGSVAELTRNSTVVDAYLGEHLETP